ncbi:MAG: hypothetical protein HKN91_11380 [Acidimicrobiia bacterium]|nr:hypothetical protein [Acidimicrobiia bacterium]
MKPGSATALLRSEPTRIGIATGALQASALIYLLVLRRVGDPGQVAGTLTAIAVAAALASVASLKSEVLISQLSGAVTAETLTRPAVVAATTLTAYTGLAFLDRRFGTGLLPIGWTPLLAFTLAVQEIQNFILIQLRRTTELLLIRGLQSILLIAAAGILAIRPPKTSIDVLGPYVAAHLVPLVPWCLWTLVATTRQSGKQIKVRQILRRGAQSSATVFINSAYLATPYIAAEQRLTEPEAADFSFSLKLFLSPITLISRSLGTIYLRYGLHSDEVLREVTRRYSMIAAMAFCPFSIGVGAYLLTLGDLTEVKWWYVPAIALSALPQAAVGPVSWVGLLTYRELHFLALAAFRLMTLSLVLVFSPATALVAVYCVVNPSLYLIYLAAILNSSRAHEHRPSSVPSDGEDRS